MLQAFIGSIKAYQVLNSGKFSDERGIRLSWECAVVKAHD